MGLRFSAADIAALEDRTEGWIAGLQLAALSMQGEQDIPGSIRVFAGLRNSICYNEPANTNPGSRQGLSNHVPGLLLSLTASR